MKKRLLSLLLALVLSLVALCGLSVSAEDNASDISVYSGTKDYDFWTNAMEGNSTEVTVMTADQLMAFAELSLGYNFAGWTIKLGADIVINTGDASTWGTTAPKYTWKCSTTWSNRFAGNFDGQGHVISGLYYNGDQECGLFGIVTGGNTIQNVSIVNSYFQYKNSDPSNGQCQMGGIVGAIDGNDNSGKYDNLTTTIKNVYVNATLYTNNVISPSSLTAIGVGGIVGFSGNTSYQTLVIENAVFEGDITTSYRNVGGILGTAWYFSIGNVSIKKCATNAKIKSNILGSDEEARVGGLIGSLRSANLDVEDCIVRGTVEVNKNKMTSAFLGYVQAPASPQQHLTADNVLLAITPLPTGDNNVIFNTMLFNTWNNATLSTTLSNVKYDSGLYSYPTDFKHINVMYGSAAVTDPTFTATAAATNELKGQAVFTDWTAVDGDYPIPAGVSVPTIDVDAYKNVEATTTPNTPTTPNEDEGTNDNTDGSNNGNNDNNDSGDNDTKAPETDGSTTDTAAEAEGGCFASVGFAGISLLALVAVAAIAISKKKVRN